MSEDIIVISDSSNDSKGPSIPRVPVEGPSVQGLLDWYGYDNIEDYLSDFYFPSTDKDTIVHTDKDPIHESYSTNSKAKYVPVSQKHNPNVKGPIAITGCVLELANVDTWDDILKKFGMRTPRRCADKSKEKRKGKGEEAIKSLLNSFNSMMSHIMNSEPIKELDNNDVSNVNREHTVRVLDLNMEKSTINVHGVGTIVSFSFESVLQHKNNKKMVVVSDFMLVIPMSAIER
nr:hypothetical protein [Tanacetum cinerariifolium]